MEKRSHLIEASVCSTFNPCMKYLPLPCFRGGVPDQGLGTFNLPFLAASGESRCFGARCCQPPPCLYNSSERWRPGAPCRKQSIRDEVLAYFGGCGSPGGVSEYRGDRQPRHLLSAGGSSARYEADLLRPRPGALRRARTRTQGRHSGDYKQQLRPVQPQASVQRAPRRGLPAEELPARVHGRREQVPQGRSVRLSSPPTTTIHDART